MELLEHKHGTSTGMLVPKAGACPMGETFDVQMLACFMACFYISSLIQLHKHCHFLQPLSHMQAKIMSTLLPIEIRTELSPDCFSGNWTSMLPSQLLICSTPPQTPSLLNLISISQLLQLSAEIQRFLC